MAHFENPSKNESVPKTSVIRFRYPQQHPINCARILFGQLHARGTGYARLRNSGTH